MRYLRNCEESIFNYVTVPYWISTNQFLIKIYLYESIYDCIFRRNELVNDGTAS